MRFNGRVLAGMRSMTAPRRIVPGQVWMVTRRCTQRQFLLRPDPETRNAFLYCLIEAAQSTGVDVVMAQMMSNHTHESTLPRAGTIVDFYQRFHTHLARCVNAQRGRWENLWASEPTCLVETLDKEKWIDQLVYIATNPPRTWSTQSHTGQARTLCSRFSTRSQ